MKSSKVRSFSLDDVEVNSAQQEIIRPILRSRKPSAHHDVHFLYIIVWMDKFRDDFVFPARKKFELSIQLLQSVRRHASCYRGSVIQAGFG